MKYYDGICVKLPNKKLLPFLAYTDNTDNTPDKCRQECHDQAFQFAGVKRSKECWCGNEEPPRSKYTVPRMCSMPCSGDNTTMCGGGDELNMYKTSKYGVRSIEPE